MFLYESCDALNPPFQLPILNSNLRRTLISTEAPKSTRRKDEIAQKGQIK